MSPLAPDAPLRPEVAAAMDGMRDPDRGLRRLGAFPLLGVALRSVPERTVPAEYWREAFSVEGHPQAVIDCPCGSHPVIELAAAPRQCEGCERWFFYAGTEVLALGSPPE